MTHVSATMQDKDWRYQALLEVVDLIALHSDLERLLPDLALCLCRAIGFDGFGVLLQAESDTPTTLYGVRMVRGENGALRACPVDVRSVPPLFESPLAALWGARSPIVLNDLSTQAPPLRAALAAAYRENLDPALPRQHAGCLLPLATPLRPVGILGFSSSMPHAYDGIDLTFLGRVATQVAVAIDNVRTHQLALAYNRQLEADRDNWRTLLEVNNAFVSSVDVEELLTAIAPNLRRIVANDSASLALFDRDGETMSLHAVDPPMPEAVAPTVATVDIAGTPFSRALALRKPIVAEPEELLKLVPALAPALSRSREFGMVKRMCLVPLFTPRRVLGVLGLVRLSSDPFTPDDLVGAARVAGQMAIAIENALAFREISQLKDRLALENLYLEDEIRGRSEFEEIIGDSQMLQRVLAQAKSVATTDATVLLTGETGTGKELIARAIHQLSARRSRALVTVNCASAPAGLLESEWFGYEKGAFTGALTQKIGRFELAHQGTLFLDEVGDIPLDLQAKLLRTLQEHEIERLGGTRTIKVDFRLVAATNRDLEAMVANREYRSDLYYRLNVFPIRIPPLRERADDIPPLVRYFTQRYAKRLKRPIESIPREVMDTLTRWSWPGNVRELQNVIERAVILSQGPSLHVPLSEFKAASDVPGGQTLEAAEREHILRTLAETGWVIGGPRGAAVRLGLKRTTLVSTMRRLGITRPRPAATL